MQDLELYGLVAVVVLGLSALAVRWLGAEQLRSPRLQVMLGIVPGLLGALLILVPKIDVVPDPLEGAVLLLPVLVVVALLAWRRRRSAPARQAKDESEVFEPSDSD